MSRSGAPYTTASVLVNDFVRESLDQYKLRRLIEKQLKDGTLKTKDKLPRNVRSTNIALGDPFFEEEDKEKAEILQHEIEHVRGLKGKKYYTQITEQDKKLPTREFKQLIGGKRIQANSPRFHQAVENFQNVFGHDRETAALKTNILTINAVSNEAGSRNNTLLLTKALKELGVDTDTISTLYSRGKDKSTNSSKGFLRKYIEEKYNITPTYVANVDLKGRDAYSFEEAVADLSMIEVMNNVDITQDPVIKNVIFNNDPETIQVYKAVSGLRTDRLDAKDLPPFTAQKIGEPTPPLLPYPDSSKSLLEELKSFFAKEKPKKSAALSDKDQVNENEAFLKNITEIKKKYSKQGFENGGEVKKTSLVDSIPVEGYSEGYQNVLNAPQQNEDLPTQDYALGALEAVPLAATSLASAVAGPIYGIFKNIASGKFGTQEGIRIADQAASEMMQKLTYEPESKSLTNFMSAVGDIATKYKLDAAIPQLLTVPIPGPASGRYAGAKTGEEIVDFMEKQYTKQREAGEFGEKNLLRDTLLPTRKEITQSAPPPRSSEPKPVEKNELGLSSKLLETTKGLKQRKGTADQLLGQLKKTLGKENKEIKDSGIEEFLADKKKVNADEVEEFIRQNQPKFVERVGKEGQLYGERYADQRDRTRMPFSEPVYFKERESGYGAEFNKMRNSSIKRLANDLKQRNTALTREEALTLAEGEYMDLAYKSVDPITGYTIVGNNELGFKIFKSEADLDKTKQYLAWDGKPFGDLPDGQVSKERLSELRDRAGRIEVPLINTLNEAKVQARALAEQRGDIDPVAEGVRFPNETETGGTNYQELRLSLDEDETLFTEGVHFPEDKNNIFHVRTTDRVYDGTQDESMPKPEKVLYVEELQSDWAQRGRKRGFKLTAKEQEPIIKDFVKNIAEQEKLFYEMIEETGKEKARVKEAGRVMNPEINTKALDEFFDKEADQDFVKELGRETLTGSKTIIEKLLPSASSGKKISRRELVKKAVETIKRKFELGTFDRQTTKEDDPLLYNISSNSDLSIEISNIAKFIRDEIASRKAGLPGDLPSSVRFAPVFEKTELIDKLNKKNVEAFAKLTSQKIEKAPFVTNTDSWTQLGIKKLLTKAVDEGYDYVSFSPGHVQYNRWGRDGLIEYYDEIIPKNAKEVVDKIDKEAVVKLNGNRFKKEGGGEFEDSEELGFPEPNIPRSPETDEIQPRFSIKITPKLKEKILKEGLPLYKKGGEVSKDTATIIELMKR